MNRSEIEAGHFYAVGVGPGAPDLVTLRAASLIQSADVIVAPRSRESQRSLALKTVDRLIDGQEVVDHVYAMTRDVTETMNRWMQVARLVDRRCDQGQSVVQITLGDPMIYSTSHYLLELVRDMMPDERIHVVPGISAFQAVASCFAESLIIQEDGMMLMPASDIVRVEQSLDQCETLVLYKAGRHIEKIAELLQRKNMLDRARLVCNSEQDGKEYVSTDLLSAANGSHGYMATVIIHVGRRTWDASPPSEAKSSETNQSCEQPL